MIDRKFDKWFSKKYKNANFDELFVSDMMRSWKAAKEDSKQEIRELKAKVKLLEKKPRRCSPAKSVSGMLAQMAEGKMRRKGR